MHFSLGNSMQPGALARGGVDVGSARQRAGLPIQTNTGVSAIVGFARSAISAGLGRIYCFWIAPT